MLLAQHSLLLEQLERDVDNTTGRMSTTNRILKRIAGGRGSRKRTVCVCVLVALLVALFIFLAATKWGCTLSKPRDQC